MKGIVVREVVSLILKPRASTAAASAIQPSQPTSSVKSTKIVFSDASSNPSKPPPKSSKEDKKAVGTSHARYCAVITFNQIILSPSQADRDVARELINIYFELFKDFLGQDVTYFSGSTEDVPNGKEAEDGLSKRKSKKQKGKEITGDAGFSELEDSNSKLISATLTGVNRALPFAKLDADDPRFKKHLDTLFLITHKSTFNITLQALLLIHQISTTASSSSLSSVGFVTDRFYRTLYASLYDSRLSTSSKQAMYLNLLFKCIKSDKNPERAKAFVRRFIQILASGGGGGAEFAAGGLHLLGEVSLSPALPIRCPQRFILPSTESFLAPSPVYVRCSGLKRGRNLGRNLQRVRETTRKACTIQGNGNPNSPTLQVLRYGSFSLFFRITTQLSPYTRGNYCYPNLSRQHQIWRSTPSRTSSIGSCIRTRRSRARNGKGPAQCSPPLEMRLAVEV